MKKEVLGRIKEELSILNKKHQGERRYIIPSEKQIELGHNLSLIGLYYPDCDDSNLWGSMYLDESEGGEADIALDVFSDEFGWQIVSILTQANVTKRYNFKDIADILVQMQEYVVDAPDEEMKEYFREITDTGFFHNAIGKVAEYNKDNTYVLVTEEY